MIFTLMLPISKKNMMVADATKCHPLFCSQKRHTKKQMIVADATKSYPLVQSEKTSV